MRYVALIVAILSLAGCVVVQPDSKTGTTNPQPPNQTTDTSEPKKNSDPAPAGNKPKTIADSIQACKRLQTAKDIPITCATRYIEGKPAMIMGFPNQRTSENWLQTITQYVTGPYCEAANSSNRQAFLGITLKNENAGRVYACEKEEWSNWFSLKETEKSEQISSLAQAKAACERIQGAQSLPVACKFNYLNDTPGIFLRLRNKSAFARYRETLMKSLVQPFCAAENRRRQFAIVAFKLDEYNLVKFYSCPDGKSTNWKNYSGQDV